MGLISTSFDEGSESTIGDTIASGATDFFSAYAAAQGFASIYAAGSSQSPEDTRVLAVPDLEAADAWGIESYVGCLDGGSNIELQVWTRCEAADPGGVITIMPLIGAENADLSKYLWLMWKVNADATSSLEVWYFDGVTSDFQVVADPWPDPAYSPPGGSPDMALWNPAWFAWNGDDLIVKLGDLTEVPIATGLDFTGIEKWFVRGRGQGAGNGDDIPATTLRVALDNFSLIGFTECSGTVFFPVVRLFPRDDARGLGSGTRIHPPPRSNRIAGGYQ